MAACPATRLHRLAARLVRTVTVVVGVALLAAGCGSSDGAGQVVGRSGGTPEERKGAALEAGKELYARNCASCHGTGLQGTTAGPPLLSDIYLPGHHSDASFHLAVDRGVQPHHWNFGPMPPVPALDRAEVDSIIAYVRSVQAREGITEGNRGARR